MMKWLVTMTCSLLLAGGMAVADDMSKESAAKHEQMLKDCVAKQDKSKSSDAATKACQEMLKEQHADQQSPGQDSMRHDAMGKDNLGHDSMGNDSMAHDAMGKDSMSRDSMSKDSMGQDTMGKDSMKPDAMGKDAMSSESKQK
jgi:pentapeptide MXKDX repeat protein